MNKIYQDSEIKRIKLEKIVLAGGCFDVLHPAHIEFLKLAKKQGNYLVIFLESDNNIRKLKGENRPLNNQITRAQNLSNIEEVDAIILLNNPTSSDYYYNLVKLLEPDIIAVTVGDPLLNVKKEQAEIVGGKVVEVMERDSKHSSTQLIKNKL